MYIKTDNSYRIIAIADNAMDVRETEVLHEYNGVIPDISEEQRVEACTILSGDVLTHQKIAEITEIKQTFDGKLFGAVAVLVPRLIRAKIIACSEYLKDTDYKATKNFELFVLGLPLEYDANELHNERQLRRDLINAYKVLLDN